MIAPAAVLPSHPRARDAAAVAASALLAFLYARSLGGPVATIDAMADGIASQPLDEQLKEIGAQLAWVRDYL